MKNAFFPALIVLAIAGTAVAMAKAPAETADEKASVKLQAAATDVAPWLQAAARDLGHTRIRAYDNSVFVQVGDDRISFFEDKGALTMQVDVDAKYSRARAEREPALRALEIKGHTIYEHAMQLKARSAVKTQVASREAAAPTG